MLDSILQMERGNEMIEIKVTSTEKITTTKPVYEAQREKDVDGNTVYGYSSPREVTETIIMVIFQQTVDALDVTSLIRFLNRKKVEEKK